MRLHSNKIAGDYKNTPNAPYPSEKSRPFCWRERTSIVDLNGDVAEMSLEWAELYADKVKLNSYVLVFDFTPIHEEKKNRTVLEFKTKDELLLAMQEVSLFFQN